LKGLAKKGESEGGSKSVEKDKAKAPKARGKEFRGSPQSMPGYTEGLFSIQDEASAFVAKIVDPKPTEFVIDLCAAPGGKTLFLAELMENTGQVLALDKSEVRLELLKKNRTVLGLTNIQIRVADATTYESETQADRVHGHWRDQSAPRSALSKNA
jgi:16S rRNA C967 or C1407 C5-methylase (RsmB/RsmF family)